MNRLKSCLNLDGLIGIVIIFIVIYRVLICCSHLPELSVGESNNIWNAIKIANGEPIYTDPENLPLEIFQYTPLSQLAIGLIAKVQTPGDPYFVYMVTLWGRLLELILNLATFLMVYRCCRTILMFDRTPSLLASLLGFSLLTHLSFAIRPDSHALLFIVGSIYLFCVGYFHTSRFHLLSAAVLVSLSFFVKQDAVFLVAPLGLTLLLSGRWKELIQFSGMFLLATASFVWLATMILGEYFLPSVIRGIQTTTSVEQLWYILSRAINFYPVHFILGNAAIVYFLFRFRPAEPLFLFSVLGVSYELLGTFSSLKVGAGISYFTPFVVISSIVVIGAAVNALTSYGATRQNLILVTTSILISGTFLLRQVYHYTSPYLKYSQGKDVYDNAFREITNATKSLNIQPDDNIIVHHPLHRNFLASNSVMVNAEYYGVSTFDYSQYRSMPEKNIKYVIFNEEEKYQVYNLMDFFHVERSRFTPVDTESSLVVLEAKP